MSTVSTTKPPFMPKEILEIAKAQRNILWCILANLGWNFIFFAGADSMSDSQAGLFLFGGVVLLTFQIATTYKLASALRVKWPLLWLPFLFVASLFVTLILSHWATSAIRAAGFEVGLLGADVAEVRAAALGQNAGV